jgi:hypothetical protein
MRIVKRHLLKQRIFAGAIFGLIIFGILSARNIPDQPLARGVIAMSLAAGWEFIGYSSGAAQYCRLYTESDLFSTALWSEISEEFFTTYQEDGEFFKSKLEGLFKRVELRDGYYFLKYRTPKEGAMLIPADAFESEEDRRRFEEILAGKGVKIVHNG